MAHATTKNRGRVIGLTTVLGGAAVVGVLAGVVLERAYAGHEAEALEQAQQRATDPTVPDHHVAPEPDFPDRAVSGLPPYKDAVPISLSKDMEVFGMPMAVAWFATRDTPDQVISFYEETLFEAGFPVVSHRFGPASGYAGWLDYFTGEMHLISAVVQGNETLVFASLSEPEKLLLGPDPWPAEVPRPEGLERISNVKIGSEGLTHQWVTALLPSTSLDAAIRALSGTFEAAGWRLGELEHLSMDQVRLSARGHGARAVVILTGERIRGGVDVLLTVSGT
jgi:hypothetical protein